ncbi:MAG: ABC transporter ATP-binding protein [Pseudomonadota bacterium]
MTVRPPPASFRLILPYITPHRHVLLAVFALLLFTSALSLTNPWMAGLLTNSVTGEKGSSFGTTPLLALWMCLMIMNAVLSFSSHYFIGSAGQKMTTEMRAHLYQHLQALPLGYYQQRRAGDTLSLLSTDAEIISSFVTDTLVQLLPASCTFIGAFLLMAWLDITVALFAVVLLPAYFIAMKFIGRRLRPLSRAWVDANSEMVSIVEENLGMLPAIKAFTREQHEKQRFEKANKRLFSLTRQQLWVGAMLSPAIGLLGGLGLLVILWIGTGHIENGKLTTGELVSVLLYAVVMMTPLRSLANVYGQVQRTRGGAERIVAFLSEQPEPIDGGHLILQDVQGSIDFHDIDFAYPERNQVLRKFCLSISAGEIIAITGKNGVGKSTLAHLLMRFADPQAGQILIDGRDIREAKLASLRAQVGLVAQQVLLLNGTVAQNISYSKPGVCLNEIEQAARSAHAAEFISELPDGYDTVIGDQGIRLSGGQRQRLALARTLLKDPPILILDEATAMFDPAGEAAFIKECHEVLKQKTVILITHRPASLALADRVVDMQYEEHAAYVDNGFSR